jgi:ABC-type Mn2+/Zn2+ transport system permease subunit
MDLIHAILHYPYVLPALGAAMAVGIVCSLLSVLIVLKRMAFIGQGISHAGFGGMGTAALLGLTGMRYDWRQDLIVGLFCIGTGFVIAAISRKRRVGIDAAIGILLAATMAWGVLMHNLRAVLADYPWYRQWVGGSGYTPPWEAILFGSPWTVGQDGMIGALVLCGVVVLVCALLYHRLLFFAFDETVARVHGVPSGWLYYLVLLLISAVIVVGIRLVGFILISALLIVPGSTALLISRRTSRVLVVALLVGVGCTTGGLLISLVADRFSPGACIVLLLTGVFALVQASTAIAGSRHTTTVPES